MKKTWKVDNNNTVTARLGDFRRSRITVNGREIPSALNLRGEHEFAFDLADGRAARLSVQRPFAMRAVAELWVEGKRMAEAGRKAVTCDACGCVVKPEERICPACGKETPPVKRNVHRQTVKVATRTIAGLAVMFAFIGVVAFVGARGALDVELATLQRMNPDDTYPEAFNGVTYTVAELSEQLAREPFILLAGNLVLAGIMVLFFLVSRRWPLAGIPAALAIYLLITVGNIIVDPSSLWKATLLKVLVVVLLARGIKAAVAVRRAAT